MALPSIEVLEKTLALVDAQSELLEKQAALLEALTDAVTIHTQELLTFERLIESRIELLLRMGGASMRVS